MTRLRWMRRSLTTVYQFMENDLNLSETSRQLFVHRNTLVYRLEKLQKTIGLDIRQFEDAMTFKIAMMVFDYMKYLREKTGVIYRCRAERNEGAEILRLCCLRWALHVLALLILALAAYLLIGGKAVSSGTESEQADPGNRWNEEDPESLYEPEENGEKVAVSTVKKIASETDKRTVGIDVSEFRGTIDWKQVADSGVEFAMIRCGYRSLGSGERPGRCLCTV